MTLHVTNTNGINQTVSVNLSANLRDGGAALDSFGMGISTLESGSGDNPDMYGKFFIDDVTYTGHSGLVDFNGASAPSGWTGSGGNTSGGNNYGWNSYSNADGSLYMASYAEEASELNKIAADGSWEWAKHYVNNFGNAADESYMYASRPESFIYGTDGFESGDASHGDGWGGGSSWSLTGNASVVSAAADPVITGSYDLQLTSNDGVASRTVQISSVPMASLSFDWKARSFESGETAVLEIYNGSSWVNAMTVTDTQAYNTPDHPENAPVHHASIDLSGYSQTSSLQFRFRSLMSDTSDYFFVDNVQVTTAYQYHVYRYWNRDGGQSAYNIAFDTFETGGTSGNGTNWTGAWTLGGTAAVTSTGTPYDGKYHLQLSGTTDSATRTVDLSGAMKGFDHLNFYWKKQNFSGTDTAYVEINNGSGWIQVLDLKADRGSYPNDYYYSESLDLSGFDNYLVGNLQVRIRMQTGGTDRKLYIDNVSVVQNLIAVDNEINAVPATDPSQSNQLSFHLDPYEWRTYASTWGMASDGYRLWVANYRENYVKVYDRNTGVLLGKIDTSTITSGDSSFYAPMAIASESSTASSGSVWITYRKSGATSVSDYAGDTVAKFSFMNNDFAHFIQSTPIPLDDPTGVTFGGPNSHLFVAESGTTHILEYDTNGNLISGSGTLGGVDGTFGSKHLGGALADDQFYWDTFGNNVSLAIDPSGILNITDDHRVQRFYTVTEGGHSAGTLYDSHFSEYVQSPIQGIDATGGTHYLLSNRYVYEVDPDYTGGPRAGWLGDGSWRLGRTLLLAHG